MTEPNIPRRYKRYVIRFEPEVSADGLDILLTKTTDRFGHVGKRTYAVNGDQLSMLDHEKVPYEILKEY